MKKKGIYIYALHGFKNVNTLSNVFENKPNMQYSLFNITNLK